MIELKGESDSISSNKPLNNGHKENTKGPGSRSSQDVGTEESMNVGRSRTTTSVSINRDEYLQAHRSLVHDLNQSQLKNSLLQRRLAEYYKKRRLEHVLKPVDATGELEEKYQQKLIVYEELKAKEEREAADIKAKLDAVQFQHDEKLEHAEKNMNDLEAHIRTTGTGLIFSKKGKPISDKNVPQTVERLITVLRRKAEQAAALCLRYVRARNAVAELETIVRKLERLGPGLYVAQYEQLCIDHENYKTKIEEREDELIKNRTKCTEHNQILAHIREKMHHTDEVIDMAECDLGDAENEFLRAREDLGQVKSRRDKLRWSLETERLKAGLLTRRDLLRDFQDATDEVVKLKEIKDKLQRRIDDQSKELRQARQRMQVHHPIQQSEINL